MCDEKRRSKSELAFFLPVHRDVTGHLRVNLGKSYFMATTVEGIDQVVAGGTACSSKVIIFFLLLGVVLDR